MYFSEFVKNNSDQMTINGNGNIEIDIDSSMLHGVTVDTYSTFTGDSWLDGVYEYASSFSEWLDYPVAGNYPTADFDFEDIEFTFNHSETVKQLSESAADSLFNEYSFIENYENISTFSPGAYNFSTDSFSATWEIISSEIDDILGSDFDPEGIENWARKEYASRSGFSSNIPRYFDNDYAWAIVWATIQKILIDDDYDGMWNVLEEEHEIYENTTEWKMTESAYRKVYTAITGTEAPKTVTDEDTLLEALPAYQDEVLFTV